jgi:hypothetical protein
LLNVKPEGGIEMIFRKIAARLVPATRLKNVGFTPIPPHRRLVATWRRDEGTGRLKLVWKLIEIQDNGRAA